MKKAKKIFLIYTNYSTFVKCDYNILSSKYNVVKYKFQASKNIVSMMKEYLKLFLFLLVNITSLDIIYCWFADYHSFLPVFFAKIFRKKSIIVVGGFDAVSIPEINFGVFLHKFRSFFARYSYLFADLILPVDESLIDSVNYYIEKNGMNIGIKHFVKNLNTEIVVLPTGYDPEIWYKKNTIIKENLVLSVGIATNYNILRRKGFDLLIEIARKMPTTNFIIIGLIGKMYDYAIKTSPNNIEIHNIIPNEELNNYFSKAKVFCQLSLSEGLPNTLCEAMLCECIPVGSNVNGIPEAIGDCGFILDERDADKGVVLINRALNSDEILGKKARQRIIDNYHIKKRKDNLLLLIKKMIKDL